MLHRLEEKKRYGWLAALIASLILAVGRVVYGVFRFVFSLIERSAS